MVYVVQRWQEETAHRAIPTERSCRTHATSSKPGQNGQNSKLTDGVYFLLDGYVSGSNSLNVCRAVLRVGSILKYRRVSE